MAMAKIKKGDTVVLLVGPKEQRGRTGEVLQVMPKENKVVVRGLKMATRHRKPTQANPQGGKDKFEAPIHISNVALADPKTGKATRVRIEADSDGKKARVAVKSGEKISG
jgi:large subunit ribosomal protein L24